MTDTSRSDVTSAMTDSASGATPILDDASAVLTELYGSALDDLRIERLVVGILFVGVKLSNGRAGVAYTPPETIHSAASRVLKSSTPPIRGMRASEVMRGNAPGPFADVIRLATLNALSASFFESGRYHLDTSGDLSGVPALFRGRRVCMVGAIIPLLKHLKDLQPAHVAIIDRKKETQEEAEAGYGTFVPLEQTAEYLGHCETAVFTGATIANGSILDLLALVPDNAAIALVGPTAGFIPEPLFARKVAMIGTVMVTDADQALEILAEGGGGYRLFSQCVKKINLLNDLRLGQLGLMER